MKAPAIDFGPRRTPLPWWAVLLCLVAFACMADALWRLGSAQARQESAERALAQARDLLALRTPPAPAQARVELPAARVEAVNRAIGRLNLPWSRLFAALEATRGESIALVAVEPEAGKRTLKLAGEARSAADMLAYVDRLAGEGSFTRVTLVKHQVNEQDANKPLRFQIEAGWKDEL